MMYNEGYFWGMHFFWWIIWIFLLIWIFAIPYNIPYQRSTRDSPIDILKKRYAKGEITKEEYEVAKKTLESEK